MRTLHLSRQLSSSCLLPTLNPSLAPKPFSSQSASVPHPTSPERFHPPIEDVHALPDALTCLCPSLKNFHHERSIPSNQQSASSIPVALIHPVRGSYATLRGRVGISRRRWLNTSTRISHVSPDYRALWPLYWTYLLALLPSVSCALPSKLDSLFDDEFDEHVARFAAESGVAVAVYIVTMKDKAKGLSSYTYLHIDIHGEATQMTEEHQHTRTTSPVTHI